MRWQAIQERATQSAPLRHLHLRKHSASRQEKTGVVEVSSLSEVTDSLRKAYATGPHDDGSDIAEFFLAAMKIK